MLKNRIYLSIPVETSPGIKMLPGIEIIRFNKKIPALYVNDGGRDIKLGVYEGKTIFLLVRKIIILL